jgi:hypothetical protein
VKRGDVRWAWRMYWATEHDPVPYLQPTEKLTRLERIWIRIFG